MNDPITQGMRRGAALFGFLKAWKRNRKANKDAKAGLPVDETLEDFNSPNEDSAMLQGKKTYLGLAAVLVGLVLNWAGVGEGSEALTAQIVSALDQVLTVGGLLLAAYGRAKAEPKA